MTAVLSRKKIAYRRRHFAKSWAMGAVIALSAAVMGCQPEAADEAGNSDTKTLDNFVSADGAELTVNECGIKMTAERYASLSARDKRKLERIIAPSDDLKRQVAGALVAVPKPLQRMFFASKGVIRVASDAAQLCAKAGLSQSESNFAAEGQQAVNSCWMDEGSLEIILKDDPKEIQHSLLRIFGFLYTEFLTAKVRQPASLPADVQETITQGLARLDKQKRQIGDALLRDVKAKAPANFSKVESLATRDSDAFRSYAVAEAIDSYYCSAKTNASFKLNFPETYRLFIASPALSQDLGKAHHQGQ